MNAPDRHVPPSDEVVPTIVPYTISVRGLCEFAAREGDLDLRFTPAPSAQDGMAGHREVQSRRGKGYRSEVPVLGEHKNLVVRGRVDGYDAEQCLLEEIKTCIGDTAKLPDNQRRMHWAQAKVYGALLCRQYTLSGITVALVYYDIRDERELAPLTEHHAADALDAFFRMLCERFLDWAQAQTAHRVARNDSLERLSFPYPTFRTGQRELAKAVFNAARRETCVLAQAPTGIGKTVATLFPMLKASPRAAIDKVCFLTAKNSGKALALSAVDTLQRANPGLALRSIELTARDRACEHPDKTCHPESCPLARGFYDRLPAARASAAQQALLTQEALREIARLHAVCPYYLAQEMTRWCDVIVADYNHYFDRSALLHDLALESGWRIALLIDEAHNLLERARAMYSASLSSEQLRAAASQAPPRIASSLARLRKQWNRIARQASSPYSVLPAPPDPLRTAVQDVTGTLAEHFADQTAVSNHELLDLYFETLAFERAIETFGVHSLFDVQIHGRLTSVNMRGRIEASMAVRNVVPAAFLGPRFEAAHCAVLFSATLSPAQFYVDMLGLPSATVSHDVPSPFDRGQLQVRLVDAVSTRYRDRDRSIVPISSLVGREYEHCPGNYLVFVSSFEYLDHIVESFRANHPDIPCWVQRRQMSEAERTHFLQRFVPDGRGVGFAVLGGVFAEGIDLVGTRLIGAFIATLGLPQVNEINEEMRRRIEALFGKGYDYAYLYPGLRKVVQAAGRVIRSETDRGSVWLIDDRYARREVRELLPAWWRIDTGSMAGPYPSSG